MWRRVRGQLTDASVDGWLAAPLEAYWPQHGMGAEMEGLRRWVWSQVEGVWSVLYPHAVFLPGSLLESGWDERRKDISGPVVVSIFI